MDTIKCIRFQHKLFDNLNIDYNVSTRSIVFWNKYQVFLYDELKYENLASMCQWTCVSEFKIAQVILSSNYIICLDYSGDIYVSPLKFKQSAQKRIRNSFQRREQRILSIQQNEDMTFSIKKEIDKIYFCIHKINSEFQLQNKIEILMDNIHCPTNLTRGKLIFSTYSLNEIQFINIKDILQVKDAQWRNQILVVLSFDNLTLYTFLICLEQTQQICTPTKLITCPCQISNISYINDENLCIIVSLASGTLLKFPLNSEFKTPCIVHLNTAIDKILTFNNTTVYTDGITMWKSENTFSESDVSFRQFKVRHVKDFVKVADQIICVTYSKLIYLISFEDESCYLDLPTKDEYCSSEHLLNNSDYLNKIMEEIKKNDQIVKKIKMEENYITTLALANRKDIMSEVIKYKIIVYENYNDILQENIPLTITNNLEEYFDTDSYYFLIQITTTHHLQQKFSEILSNLFGNLKIHITIFSEQKLLKTISIKVKEQLRNINIVIPFNAHMINFTSISVNIKLVTLIPGALNEKETLWANLHFNKIVFNSEHFIKIENSRNNIEFLKEPKKSIVDLIYETACNHYGQIFKVNKVATMNKMKLPFYIKLPKNFRELLLNRAYYMEMFNASKTKYMLSKISSEEFLKSKNSIFFNVCTEKVDVELINDGFSDPLLQVTSQNHSVSLGIRNFFSNIFSHMIENSEKEFVSNTIYDTIENIEKMISSHDRHISSEDFFEIFDKYQKNVIGAILI